MKSKLIDTHVHFWDLKNQINSWVINSGDDKLMQDYNLSTYAENVHGIVVIEACDLKHSLDEAIWLQNKFLTNESNIIIKHIAGIDLLQNSDSFNSTLEQFSKLPFVVGFRHILSYDENVSYLPCNFDVTCDFKSREFKNFIQNLKTLKEKEYIFNCQMYPNQLIRIYDFLIDIGISCTIDHCGLPVFSDEQKKNIWYLMLKQYSNSNAIFKISGFDINNSQDYFLEIVKTMFNELPIDNLIFGSNYPLSSNTVQRSLLTNLLKDNNLMNHHEQIFFSNANKLYKF